MEPEFSIILPIYKVEKYIQQCLESILSQTFADFELLCVDDCGNDNSMNIVEWYAQRDDRIKILVHEHNKGLGAARNTALRAAKGKYIVCIDSDDWVDKNLLFHLKNIYENNDINSVWYKANVWWENRKIMSDLKPMFPCLAMHEEGIVDLTGKTLGIFPAYAWNKSCKRDLLINNNLFWPEGVIWEDVEMYFKTFIISPTVYILDKKLYYYRRRSDSIIEDAVNNGDKAKDVYTNSINLYNYLVKTGKLEEYKSSYYRWVHDAVIMFKPFPNTYSKLLPYIYEMLNKVV